jgi:sugar O-acyltransferase (sialic acid O-acetyltransferase NeuD family)
MGQLGIYGAGGLGRETASLVESLASQGRSWDTVFFIDDNQENQGTEIMGLSVLGLEEAKSRYPEARIVGAVGIPAVRRSLMERSEALGFKAATLVHPSVEVPRTVEVGVGTIVFAGCVLTTHIRIGRHVLLNPGCTVSHDSVIEDYASLSPGVHIAGNVVVGSGAFLGTGTTTVHGSTGEPLVIGSDTVVGAGACVTCSLDSSVLAVGVPAKVIKQLG